MFCMHCGSQNHNTSNVCAHCGAANSLSSSSLAPSHSTSRYNGSHTVLPVGIQGWSWGAFSLNWIWAIGNRTWWGLLALVPYVGLIVAIWLGFRGRELAWKNAKWDSVEHFNRVQRLWSIWGVVIWVVSVVGMVAAIAIPAYYNYGERAKAANVEPAYASESTRQSVTQDAWEQQLVLVAQVLNKQLPEKVDAITTMTQVIAGPGRTFTYMYTVDVEKHHIAAGQLDTMRESVAEMACSSTEVAPFFENGTTIVYHYVDKNNRKVTEINLAPTFCSNRKAKQSQRRSTI